jgi:fibronectin-binding autotransporter adhesin
MKPHSSTTHRSPIILPFGRVRLEWLLLAFLFLIPQLVFGADKHWTGTTNTTWSTGTNWFEGTPPGGTADNAVFDGTFTTGNQPNLTATTTAGGLWMTGSIGQNVVISGSTLTLQGNTIGGTAGLGILMDNANAFTLTISAPLKLGAAQTWRNNSGGLLTISTGGVNTNNKALTIDGSGNTTISGVVSSGGAITKAGSGTLTLSGANTFTGALTIQSGTLSIATINNASSNGVLGNSATAVTLGGSGTTGTLQYTGSAASSTKTFTMATGGTGVFDVTNSGTTLTLSGVIGGSGNLTKDGPGTLTLSGVNTFSGVLTVETGNLSIATINNASANGVLGNSANAVVLGSSGATGTLQYTGSTASSTKRFTMATGGTGAFQVDTAATTLTLSGVIDGSGALMKTGAGTLALSGTNTYSGGTTLSAGTLQLSGSGTLGSTSGALTINGGTLNLNGTNQGVGNLTGSGGTILNNSTGTNVTLTIGNSNGTGGNYSGVIADHTSGTGTVALTKTGTGTITLSGTNTYTGATTVNAGTLLVNGNNSAATGAVSVNNSGTTLGGTGTIGGAVTVNSGANLLGGTGSTASGTLTLANNLTLNSGSIIELALGASGAHSTLARTGGTWVFSPNQAFTFINLGAQDATTYNNIITGLGSDPGGESGWTITNTGWIGTFTYDGANIDLNVIVVPEPSTWIAGALALGVVGWTQRRRLSRMLKRT